MNEVYGCCEMVGYRYTKVLMYTLRITVHILKCSWNLDYTAVKVDGTTPKKWLSEES